ncbi:MAG: nucleotide sugar dehydrogenase [Phycisphaerales bacterium]
MTTRGDYHAALLERIESRRAVVAVMGLGYVGLPLLHAVAAAGFPVLGLDHDGTKIEKLRRGENYLPHLGASMASDLASNPRAALSNDPASLAGADAILICVPTPIDEKHEPDLGAVERAARDIRDHAIASDPTRPRLIVLESTTYPGTTRDIVGGILAQKASRPGDEEQAASRHQGHISPPRPTAQAPLPTAPFLAFSPEREDPGNASFSTRTIPKLVGGVDAASGELAVALYSRVVSKVIPVSSAEVAEAAKVVENVYRAVNIALVNELKIALDAMGLDIWEVLDAAATKPFGFHRFNPGPGFGGHCVPVDPFYLSWKAAQVGAKADFIELAGVVNRRMPEFVISRCRKALEQENKPLNGARVLVLGLAYKPNIADVRESPSFELIDLLREAGAEVSYHDPHVPQTWRGRRHDLQMRSVSWSEATLAGADLVLISTDHDWYDWAFVARHATLVVDTRNAMARAGAGGAGARAAAGVGSGRARVVKA